MPVKYVWDLFKAKDNNCPSHITLLKVVQQNNRESIYNLLKVGNNARELLKYRYGGKFENRTILQIACDDQHGMVNVNKTTIKFLVENGGNLSEPTIIEQWQPLHFAAINANIIKLEAIISSLQSPELIGSLVFCSPEVLKKYPVRNAAESFSNNFLHLFLKSDKIADDLSIQFLENFFRQKTKTKDILLFQRNSTGEMPWQLIQQNDKLRDNLDLRNYEDWMQGNPIAYIFVSIMQNENTACLQYRANLCDGFDENGQPKEAISSCTLLQLSCHHNNVSSVQHLLDLGAKPHAIVAMNTDYPLVIAAKKSFDSIFNLLLENSHDLPQDIIIKFQIRKVQESYLIALLQYIQTRNVKDMKKCLRATDENGRTALHHATYWNRSQVVLKLLEMGASLIIKDNGGICPMQMIDADLLKICLNSCMKIPLRVFHNDPYTYGNEKENSLMEIDYKNFIFHEESSISDNYYRFKNILFHYPARDEEVLLGTNDSENTKVRPESEFLNLIIQAPKFHGLIDHPVVSTLLVLKGKNFVSWFIVDIIIYSIAYGLLLLGYFFSKYPDIYFRLHGISVSFFIVSVLWARVFFTTKYYKRLENWLNIVVIFGISYIMIALIKDGNLTQSYVPLCFCAVALLSTYGFYMKVKQLPKFTVDILMLVQVSQNFLSYMMFYNLPILVFWICFATLAEDYWGKSLHKLYDTVFMFFSENDRAYPSTNMEMSPIAGRIIYIVFIIVVGNILHNFLIALAISDLQSIRNQSEFKNKKHLIENICEIEDMLYQHHKWRIFKMIRNNLKENVFGADTGTVLVVEPFNGGCVYVKDQPGSVNYLPDRDLIGLLQERFYKLLVQE